MHDYKQVIYENAAPGVARIVINRPEKLNAQGNVMTYELDDAFKRACHDDSVNVIILAGSGSHFNAGHDLSGQEPLMPSAEESRGLWGQYGGPGWEGFYSREKEMYLELTERWRNASKPTIAEIQGAVVAGGLMLAWACDLIVCSEDAKFRDNTAAELGVPGVEFFQHPFEMGVRKAKEWLFTGDWMGAAEAERRGMVNRVVPRTELANRTLELAVQIAANDRFTMKLVKEAINKAQDLMGRKDAMDAAFSLHQIGHMQNMLVHGFPIDASRLHPSVRAQLEKGRAAATAQNPVHRSQRYELRTRETGEWAMVRSTGFEQKVVVVTGGASGIGRATVEHLARKGARVMVTDWSERRGRETETDLRAEGLEVSFQHHDAGDDASWGALEARIKSEFGLLHALVNNAYSGRLLPFESVTVENLRDGMRVNCEGAVLGMQVAGRLMGEGGAIVNMASVAAFDPSPENMAYAIAKSTVIHLTRSFALGYAKRRPLIRVNCVAPGLVATPALRSTLRATDGLAKDADVSQAMEAAAATLPIGRIADPAELANAIAFLLSSDASYITGQCLTVDGGYTLR